MLLAKAKMMQNQLYEFQAVGVTRHVLLTFFQQIMVSQVNYGTMVDDAATRSIYEDIDKVLIDTCNHIMECSFMTNDLICKPKKNGGLGLMLPGAFFAMTN